MRSIALFLLLFALPHAAQAFPDGEKKIASLQRQLSALPLGERIARWAEEFVGTPYDPDPDGEYVTRRVVVADRRVDCMYHVFRSVELAMSENPEGARRMALTLRFITRGRIEDRKVANYEERFRYALDMLQSGKWGKEITAELAPVTEMPGARGLDRIEVIPRENVPLALPGLRSGDIVFFIKDPGKRVAGEAVGHLGIIKREGAKTYLIHASGRKNKGGRVRKVPLLPYVRSMPFVGIKVSRFSEGVSEGRRVPARPE
jgi:hypothetical protein